MSTTVSVPHWQAASVVEAALPSCLAQLMPFTWRPVFPSAFLRHTLVLATSTTVSVPHWQAASVVEAALPSCLAQLMPLATRPLPSPLVTQTLLLVTSTQSEPHLQAASVVEAAVPSVLAQGAEQVSPLQ